MIYKGAILFIVTCMAINGSSYFLTQGNSLKLNDKSSYKESVDRTEKLNSLGRYKNEGHTQAVIESLDNAFIRKTKRDIEDNLEPYCKVRAINFNKKINGKDAIIFANPDSRSRSNGTVRVGLIDKTGTYNTGEPKYKINWKYKKLVKPDYYAYSCLSELNNRKIGLIYEDTPNEEMSYIKMNLKCIHSNLNNINKGALFKLLTGDEDITEFISESVKRYKKAIPYGRYILNHINVTEEQIDNVINEIQKVNTELKYNKPILLDSAKNNIEKN